MFGAIVGDVVGSPYEFSAVKSEDFPLITPDSAFTDDTVMTVAVGIALMRCQGDPEVAVNQVAAAMRQYGRLYPQPHGGYGARFAKWLKTPEPAPAYDSLGNGAAMRVSAVGWMFDSLDEVEQWAKLTALPTHNHPEGIRAAQATASAVFLTRMGMSKSDLRQHLAGRYGYDLDRTVEQIRPTYTYDETAAGSVPEAIVAYLDSSGFEDAIRKAVSLGGDADTQAAIAGAIAQAAYPIPETLRAQVRDKLDTRLRADVETWSVSL